MTTLFSSQTVNTVQYFRMKTCNKCLQLLSLEMFKYNDAVKKYLRPFCIPCDRQYASEQYSEKSYVKERVLSTSRQWRKLNPYTSEQIRRHNLKKNHNITIEQYNQMVIDQEQVCALCGNNDPKTKNNNWNIDHNHNTNKIRGLLCMSCNTSLGHYEKLIQRVGNENIVKYLEKGIQI